jgi:hypothetical protein
MYFRFCQNRAFADAVSNAQTLAGKRVETYEPRHTFAKPALPRFLTEDFYNSLPNIQNYFAPERKTRNVQATTGRILKLNFV